MIDYGKVIVAYGPRFPGLQKHDEFVTLEGHIYPGKSIYKDNYSSEYEKLKATYIHEFVHVWQHQNNKHVGLRAAVAHAGRGYDYLPLEKGKPFSSYNVEQQGAMVEDYFLLKRRLAARWAKKFGKTPPSIEQLRALIPIVR